MSKKDFKPVTFRHRSIAHFKVGRFIFEDHILTLKTEQDVEDFENTMARQPRRLVQDVIISEERELRSMAKSRVVRDAQDSGQVVSGVAGSGRALTVDDLSAEERARIEAQAYADARRAAEEKLAVEMKAEIESKLKAAAAIEAEKNDSEPKADVPTNTSESTADDSKAEPDEPKGLDLPKAKPLVKK